MLIKARQMERAKIILDLFNLQAKRMSDEEARRVRNQRLQQSGHP